ncbi:formate/nitrite transporter family protein [uncultured Brevundimonas sp.]|uniref:formate/nitrite transporter family protein n=1 Tax=uncultured Brevundimonas sp. TaxID=213418 RepID=UPI002636B0D6|nr:formate/nitrite transporter family protein [uncultured Brevundimonas sp.]
MFKDTVAKLSDLSVAKARALEDNPLGYFIAAALAGIYVGFGILLIFSLGSVLDPAVRPLVMGASFGLALILVVFAGSELYTGLTMIMALGRLEGKVGSGQLARVWAASWVGNLVGALLLGAIFVTAGGGAITGAASEFIYKAAAAKMDASAVELFARAILCNWLVCLALWMSSRIASETARMIAIAWCLFAFIASGYEHSIANMTVFAVALLSPHPDGVTWAGAGWNLLWVTAGNTVAGALFMGALPWLASREARAPARAASFDRPTPAVEAENAAA